MPSLQDYDAFLARVRATRKRVLVIGDWIDDVYVKGRLTGTAPEGGAPVFEVDRDWAVPGGAGNVAKQLEPWNVSVQMVGGAYGHRKTRYLVDEKVYTVVSERDRRQIPADVSWQNAKDFDAVIVADYDKGAVTEEVLNRLESLHLECLTIVDPPANPVVRWQSFGYLLSGCIYKMNQGQWKRWGCPPCDVVTRGAEPPLVMGDEVESESPPVRAFDTCGAGDHFSAVLTVGLIHGLYIKTAASFAHEASKLRVQHRRPRPILPSEVRGVYDPPLGKILPVEDVAALLKHTPGKVVFTNGCFRMGLHAGHCSMLDFARRQGGVLVVAVNSDESVRRLRGDVRMMPADERMRLVASHAAVDYVVALDGEPADVIRSLGTVDVLVKGPDWEGQQISGADLVGRVALAPVVYVKHTSDWE